MPFAALFAVSATAANISWNGAADAVWSTGGNWVGGVAPVAADVAVFDAGSSANLTTSLGTDFTIAGLKITTPGGLITIGGANTLTLGAGGIDMSAASQNLLIEALVALAADQSWNVANGRTLTVNGIISGTNVNLNKIGLGDLILGGANTFTGITTIGGGTLTLNGSLNGTTGTDLTFAGTGTFNVSALSGGGQGMKALSFSGGDGTVRSTNNGGTSTVSFTSRAVRVAGATGNFSLPNGTQGAGGTNNITIGGELTAQLLDRGLFYNGSQYAAYDTGGFVRGLNYGTDANAPASIPAGTTLGVNDATQNVEISGDITAQTTASVNTIRVPGAFNIALDVSQTLSLNGILKSGGSAATISGGTGITTTAANNEMVIRTDVAGDTLNISTPILVNGTSSLTKSGSGTLALSGANTYTGITTINSGIVLADHATALGNGGNIKFSGGTLQVGSTLNNTTAAWGGRIVGSSAPIKIDTNSQSLTLSGTIASSNTAGLVKSGTGTLLISNSQSYSGATEVIGGTLKLSAPTTYSGLKGSWTFDAQNANDVSGNGYNGTAVNAPTYSTDTRSGTGYSLQLNGSNQLVYVDTGGTQSVFDGGSAMTISAWVKGWPGTWSPFVSKFGENTQGWQMRKNAGSGTNLSWTTRPQGDTNNASSVNNGAWHMITMTYDAAGGANNKKIYVDGALLAQSTATGNIGASAAMLAFGARANSNAYSTTAWGSYFNGKLDEIYFFNRAITSGEVTDLNTNPALFAPTSATLPSATILSIATDAIFDLNGNTQQVASLADYVTGVSFGAVQNTNVASASSLVLTTADRAVFTGVLAGGGGLGALGLVMNGAGTQVLAGANTYTGGTTLTSGKLQLGGTGTLGATSSSLTVNGGILDLNNTSQTVGNLSGTGGTIVNNQGTGTVTFTIGSGNNGGGNFLGVIADKNDSGTGVIALTKTGSGTITLSGANTYSGATAINGGILQANHASAMGNGGIITFGGGALQFGSSLNNQTVNWGARIQGNTTAAIALDTNGQTVTLDGAIPSSNTLGLTKTGAGTLILSGANAYTGTTAVNAGTLTALNSAALPNYSTATITVAVGASLGVRAGGASEWADAEIGDLVNNASLTFTGAATLGIDTTSGDFSTAAVFPNKTNMGIAKNGANTLTLSGASVYSGPTVVSGGILKAGIASVAGVSGGFGNNSAVTLANTAGVALDIAGFDTQIGSLAGGGASGGNVTLGANTLTVGGDNANTIFTGVISSSAGVTGVSLHKIGAGSLTLRGANTFTGKIVIAGGILFANDENGTVNEPKLGATPSVFVADSITIRNGAALTMLSGTDGRSLSANRGIYLDTGMQTINTGGGDFFINGVISGPGGLFHGNGGAFGFAGRRLYLPAANTYTGDTKWDASGSASNYGGIEMQNPLALQNSAVDANSVASWLGASTSGGVLQLGGLINGNRTLQDLTANATFTGLVLNPTIADAIKTYTNVIGTGNHANTTLTKTGAGTQALNGANAYTGATSIKAGTLSINTIKNVGSATASSLGKPTTVANGTISIGNLSTGATLLYTGTGDTTDRVINLAGTTGGAMLDQSGASGVLTFTSNFTATGVGAKMLTLQGSTAGAGVIGGQIVDSSGGATSLTKTGTGAWTLNGANTHTGDTTLNGGTLTIGNLLALQNSALNYTAGTLSFSAGINTPTFGGLTGSTSFALAANVTDLTLNPGTGVTKTYSGTFGSDLPGMNLIKNGAGTQRIGVATYTGSTAVNVGKLYLNGSNITAAISVAGGATLGGSGSAVSAVATVADSGIIEAGSGGVGGLSLGGLNFTNTSTINVANIGNYSSDPAFNVINADGLVINGGVGSITIFLGGTPPPSGTTGTSHLIQYNGSIGGSGAGFGAFALNTAGLGASPRSMFTLTNPAGYVDVNYTIDSVVWKGTGSGNWITENLTPVISPANWKLASNPATETNFILSDAALFDDTAAGTTTVNISAADVTPASVTFNNTAKDYALQGGFGITGGTALSKGGSGKLTITTNNSYTGGTTINGGTIQIGDGGIVGSLGTGAIVDDGILSFNRSDLVTIADAISGTGSIIKNGDGELVLSGTNSYGGNTTLNTGKLTFASALALGNSTLIINSGTLDSGVAGLVLTSNNAQTWNSDFAFSGTNDLDLGSGAVSLGSAVGARTLSVNAGTLTVRGAISDGASTALTKAGAGTLVLDGISNYSGGTTINTGTLTVNDGANLGASSSPLAVNNPNTGDGTNVVLNLNGSVSTGSLSGAIAIPSSGTNTATINIAVSKTLTLNQTTDGIYDGAIAGAGKLIKRSSGKLTLSGSNTHAGTSLDDGILSVSSLSALGNGGLLSIALNSGTFQYSGHDVVTSNNFNLAGGAVTLDIVHADASLTLTNAYHDSTITKKGAGTFALAGNVYYIGYNFGSLVLSIDEGTMVLGSTVTDPAFMTTVNSVTDVKTGATLKLGNAQGRQIVPTNPFHMSGGTFDLNGNTNNYEPQIDGTGIVTNSSATAAMLMVHPSNTKTFGGNIVDGIGTVGLQFRNNFGYAAIPTATWTLSGNNTYSGASTVGVGTIQAGSITALSPNSAYTVEGGATLNLDGFSNTIGSLTGAGSVTLGSATLSIGNDNTSPAAFSAAISGVGGSVNKIGIGVLALAAANTYTGQTTVSQGTLKFQIPAALYNADASKWTKANITVNSGAVLALAVGGAGQFIAADINTLLDAAHLGASDSISGLLYNASIGFDTAGGDFTMVTSLSNQNSGANVLGVQKFGANTLTFTGANTYSGATTINAGVLQIGNGGSTGNLGSGNVINNGSLVFNRSDALTVSNAITGTGSLTKLGSDTLVLSGANTFTGATTIGGGVLSINSIQNAGSATPNQLGNPAVGANSIIGLAATSTLRFTGSADGSSDRVIHLTSEAGGTFTLDASGSAPLALSGGITTAGISGISTLVLSGSGEGSEGGAIVNGTASNVTAVEKNGGGTWILSGTNTYTGDTTVNAGILYFNGSTTSNAIVNAGMLEVNGTLSGSTTVNSGGTLSGSNGTLGNVTVESSGTLSPGGSGTGSLTVNGDLELKASSNFNVQFDTDGGFVDAISVNGNLTIVTGAVFNVNDIGSAPDGFLNFQNDIITYSGTWNGGTFLGLQDDSIFTSEGVAYLISYNDNDINGLGLHAVTLTIVPEPGAAVTLLGGLGLLLGMRRRRS